MIHVMDKTLFICENKQKVLTSPKVHRIKHACLKLVKYQNINLPQNFEKSLKWFSCQIFEDLPGVWI